MSCDWTALLVVDACLLVGAAFALVGLVLRDLRRARGVRPERAGPQEKGDDGAPSPRC